mmetsp:Transcript_14194/g.27602  ORF Transcript_14194/g.27602 Transcript_14194/m.27602 type:complete len:85 (+) Transcript_14194:1218-1472(+)
MSHREQTWMIENCSQSSPSRQVTLQSTDPAQMCDSFHTPSRSVPLSIEMTGFQRREMEEYCESSHDEQHTRASLFQVCYDKRKS